MIYVFMDHHVMPEQMTVYTAGLQLVLLSAGVPTVAAEEATCTFSPVLLETLSCPLGETPPSSREARGARFCVDAIGLSMLSAPDMDEISAQQAERNLSVEKQPWRPEQ